MGLVAQTLGRKFGNPLRGAGLGADLAILINYFHHVILGTAHGDRSTLTFRICYGLSSRLAAREPPISAAKKSINHGHHVLWNVGEARKNRTP